MKQRNWVVFGHYGGYNTGDEAMLSALVMACHPNLRKRLVVISQGELPPCIQGEGVQVIPPKTFAILREILRCRGIILGGGTHFQDDFTTLTRYIRHARYMARFVGVSLLAAVLGKKVLWLSMGFGPFAHRASSRWLTKLGLLACKEVVVRERVSFDEVKPWINKDRLSLGFDMAVLLLQAGANISYRPNTESKDWTPILGISVTPTNHLISADAEISKPFWKSFKKALHWVIEETPTRIRFFVIRGGTRESDIALTTKMFLELKQFFPDKVELISYQNDPTQTLRLMAECKAFVASRFHSAVFAYMTGCDLLFLAYHRKLEDLAKEIGLDQAACVILDSSVTDQLLQEKFQTLLNSSSINKPTLPISVALDRANFNIEMILRYDDNPQSL